MRRSRSRQSMATASDCDSSCRMSTSSGSTWRGASQDEARPGISACRSRPRANANVCDDDDGGAQVGSRSQHVVSVVSAVTADREPVAVTDAIRRRRVGPFPRILRIELLDRPRCARWTLSCVKGLRGHTFGRCARSNDSHTWDGEAGRRRGRVDVRGAAGQRGHLARRSGAAGGAGAGQTRVVAHPGTGRPACVHGRGPRGRSQR